MSEIDIKEVLTKISNQVDPIIERLLKNNIEGSSVEMALYQCGVGGKRIRPALLILTGQAFGAKIKDLLYPSASIEILHNLTLIIDDIIDHSEFRRDKPTVWKKYGKSIAMCDSLFYGAAVFEGLEKYPS
ncbi:polyprenyl synthetase family protein, partial [Candidatus Saccharibacteria bacterium]|nr:polyprenyl synthetase family protein [Candidatus Saccharibacteria bacterium]